jgi:DNA excision repair protein ERCC-2
MIITKGLDHMPISTKFDERENQGIIRNYGALLDNLASTVPDGIICFFPSYSYMEHIFLQWHELNILNKIREKKMIFVETKDNTETALCLENYKTACDIGRGGIFISVARGKVAEGVDFDGHYGRAVVMFGIPF